MVFDNQQQCSVTTGFPIKKLKLAKNKLGASGFKGNRIDWDEFQAWLAVETNAKALEDLYDGKPKVVKESGSISKTLEEVELENKIKDGIVKDLTIKKLSGEYLDLTEVGDFLVKLRLTFEGVVKGWSASIPPKLVGKSQAVMEDEITKNIASLLSTFENQIKSQMAKCTKKLKNNS